MFPFWVYVAVALLIASAAFALGQWIPGLGVTFVAGASTMWVAYVAHRSGTTRKCGRK